MLLFIEGYPYPLNHKVKGALTIKDILENIVSFSQIERIQSFSYVGYCYSKKARDVVFYGAQNETYIDEEKSNRDEVV